MPLQRCAPEERKAALVAFELCPAEKRQLGRNDATLPGDDGGRSWPSELRTEEAQFHPRMGVTKGRAQHQATKWRRISGSLEQTSAGA